MIDIGIPVRLAEIAFLTGFMLFFIGLKKLLNKFKKENINNYIIDFRGSD